jgi:TRAP-type uncharacterized transport system substrate-binding protein
VGHVANRWIGALVVFVAATTATGAAAQGVVIASGTKGGYYHAVARGLRAVLRSEYDIATDVASTGGSMENLALLADPDSLVNLALAQADALQSFLVSRPGFAADYVQVGDAGKECAFIVTRSGGITSLDGLAADGRRTIAIGEAGSGAAVTWANMTRLRPALGKTLPVEQGVIEALLDLRAPGGSGPVAALMVQRPMAVATPLEIVLQNAADYTLVPVARGALGPVDRHDDAAGYSYEKVVVGLGREYQASVDTICTRALVLAARRKLSPQELDAVTRAIARSRRYIMPDGR